jgi:hypothetical protein
MPITIFDVKGIAAQRRERVEAAVMAGGKTTSGAHEAWIVADSLGGSIKVRITGPEAFDRCVAVPIDEDPVIIAERVRETLQH